MGNWKALAILGLTLCAPGSGAESGEDEEKFVPGCAAAVVIARNIEAVGIPYALSDGEKIELSAFRFDVDRVLFGRVSASRLVIRAPQHGARMDRVPGRWLFVLSGSDALGWRELDR